MKKAFTLIELLVVIAIIAILAAILFPVFAQAKEAAKKTACLSNVKQQATATILYINDYDDTYAQSAYATNKPGGALLPGASVFSVYDAVLPYTKNTQIFQCPDSPKAIDWAGYLAGIGMTSASGLTYASYAPNFSVFTDPAIANNPPLNLGISTVSQTSIPDLVGTTLFYDASFLAPGKTNPDFARLGLPSAGAAPTGNLVYKTAVTAFGIGNFPGSGRHGGSINVNFSDGHAKSVRETGVLPGTAQDTYYTGVASIVRVYNLPYDLNGIPDVIADPRP